MGKNDVMVGKEGKLSLILETRVEKQFQMQRVREKTCSRSKIPTHGIVGQGDKFLSSLNFTTSSLALHQVLTYYSVDRQSKARYGYKRWMALGNFPTEQKCSKHYGN